MYAIGSDHGGYELKQAVMPKDMPEAQKQSLLDQVVVKSIITNT